MAFGVWTKGQGKTRLGENEREWEGKKFVCDVGPISFVSKGLNVITVKNELNCIFLCTWFHQFLTKLELWQCGVAL